MWSVFFFIFVCLFVYFFELCGVRNRSRGAGTLFLPAGRGRSLWGQVAFSMAGAGCLRFGHRGTEGKGFGGVNRSLQTGKQWWLEGKAGEGWQLEARLEKLAVPGDEDLKHSARWLDLLHCQEAMKGARESPKITGLQGSGPGWSVRCLGKNPANFLHFSIFFTCRVNPVACPENSASL